jgi:precorrin-3B methylase
VATDTVWPFDVGIVGTGIVGAHQLTRESEEVIRRSRRTFVIDSGYGVAEYLNTLCPEVTRLGSLYEPGRDRLLTYRKMAAEVLAAAAAAPPVCLAVYGHPWVYCYPTTLITTTAPLLNLRVSVFPGISAFDTLLVDLGIDIGPNGVQMYEATDLLLRRRPIQSDVMCVIWQPTVVGDPTYPTQPYTIEQFRPLQEYLERFYPVEHEVILVTTRTHPLTRSTIRRFKLSDLATELVQAPPVATLYIAPVLERAIEDTALLEAMLTAGVEPPAVHDPVAGGTPA